MEPLETTRPPTKSDIECRKCHCRFVQTPSQIKRHRRVCLACRRIYEDEWRIKRRALGLSARGGSMSREYYAAYETDYYAKPEVKRRRAASMRKYRTVPATRRRHLARDAVHHAVAYGHLLRQPCCRCGTTKSIEAHHIDYSKPLDVIWYCRSCHQKAHRPTAQAEKD